MLETLLVISGIGMAVTGSALAILVIRGPGRFRRLSGVFMGMGLFRNRRFPAESIPHSL